MNTTPTTVSTPDAFDTVCPWDAFVADVSAGLYDTYRAAAVAQTPPTYMGVGMGATVMGFGPLVPTCQFGLRPWGVVSDINPYGPRPFVVAWDNGTTTEHAPHELRAI